MPPATPLLPWIRRDGGPLLRVPLAGLTVGRRADCDILLTDRAASHVQALLLPAGDGVEVFAMGRNPTTLGGEEVRGRAYGRHGDVIDVPGARLEIVTQRAPARGDVWTLDHPDGHRYGLRSLPCVVGGGSTDDLQVPGWPAAALTLSMVQGALAAELACEGLLNDFLLPAGAVEMIEAWDCVTVAGVSLTLRLTDTTPEGAATEVGSHPVEVRSARFRFRPTGGVLALDFGQGEVRVELAEMRARLVAALLQPPRGYAPGDHIPDDVLLRAIWPGTPARGRTDLNLLLHRARKDLLRLGIDPSRLIERPRHGGSARFRLAPGAVVSVK